MFRITRERERRGEREREEERERERRMRRGEERRGEGVFKALADGLPLSLELEALAPARRLSTGTGH